MKKKRKSQTVILTACFILLFLCSLALASSFLERKSSRAQYAQFWSDPNEYDVWLLGNSHMYYGIHPMTLWKEYGIRSYNLAAPRSYPPQTYWTFYNALCYGQPKAVLVDCYHIGQEIKSKPDSAHVHTGFDCIPLSPAKMKAVFDIFAATEQRIEYLFTFYIYHNRWETLSQEDFKLSASPQKGSKSSGEISDQTSYSLIEQTDMLSYETTGHIYIRKIIEECQKRKIPVILTGIPTCVNEEAQRGINSAEKMAEEYGIPFLNMPYDESLAIDYRTDFKDKGHLNILGSRKVSEYIGSYLENNFPFLKKESDDASRQKWEEDYAAYKNEKIQYLKNTNNLEEYLAWLSEPEFSFEIYQSDSFLPSESVSGLLLEKTKSKTKQISYDQAKSILGAEFDGDTAVIAKDAKTGEPIDAAVFLNGTKQ